MTAMSVKDLLDAKGKRQLAYVQVAREEEAIAASAACMDMIGTAFVPERAHFAKAVPNSHFQFGMPWGKHADATEVLRDAMAAMQAGAQSVYCGMSPHIVEVLAREGVPVICHVGLVPPKATRTGGYRAVGRTLVQAKMVWQQVQDFEAAGAFAVEMEVVAANLATEITARTSMVTISLGLGGGCDAQYLFLADLLVENTGHVPRHAKTYRNFAAERERLQTQRFEASKEYIADVTTGAFPETKHTVTIDEDELSKVWDT